MILCILREYTKSLLFPLELITEICVWYHLSYPYIITSDKLGLSWSFDLNRATYDDMKSFIIQLNHTKFTTVSQPNVEKDELQNFPIIISDAGYNYFYYIKTLITNNDIELDNEIIASCKYYRLIICTICKICQLRCAIIKNYSGKKCGVRVY